MIYEESYGTIPLKRKGDKWKTFLIKNKNGNHWGFPKGHANLSETSKAAAARELKEEANLKIDKYLFEQPIIEEYCFVKNSDRIAKKIYYYIVEVQGEGKITSNEILEGKWVDMDKAKDQITFDESKAVAIRVEMILQKL